MNAELSLIAPAPIHRATPRLLIVDSFAGGGGASTGIEMALGRGPDVAINHDPAALAMHEANHPETRHLVSSVYSVDPRDVVAPGQEVGLAWFSPDCKHHSRAKGGKPVEKNIRDLAWVVVHWAERVRPRVIALENVAEFLGWCPLTPENRPDLTRKGETFRIWVARLHRLGYRVEWRLLRACDYGAPTIRRRLFLIARRDGKPIVWPDPTHAAPGSPEVIAGTSKPWRTAAEIIDWSLPCPSIFDTSAQIMEKHGLRALRPLRDATCRRIARGVMRYVIDAAEPFLISVAHGGGGSGKHALVAAFLAQHNGGARMKSNAGRAAVAPVSTLTASRSQQQLVVAHLVTMRNSTNHSTKPMNRSTRSPQAAHIFSKSPLCCKNITARAPDRTPAIRCTPCRPATPSVWSQSRSTARPTPSQTSACAC